MSTSLRRSSGPTATRNVIGWSLPITLPTAANPSNESSRETRSTVVVSTRIVSLRTPEPKMRASEAASLAGGAAGCCVASRRTASPARTSELVAEAEAQDLVLADAGRVADQLVIALERRVPGGLVREAERGDAARQGGPPRDSVEGGGLVGLVDDPDRYQHQPRAQREPVLQPVVEECLLDLDLAGRPAGLDPRVLHLELGPKAEALVEAVGQVHHEATQRRPTGGVGAGSVGVLHFPVSPERGALLGDQAALPRAHEASAQRPHEQAPHHGCSVSQVEIWYRQRDSRMYHSGFTRSSKRYCCPSCASWSRCWGIFKEFI